MAATGKNRKLSPKQTRFIQEYLVDPNQKSAAIKAGYAEKTAAIKGWQLVNNDLIATEIQLAMDKRAAKAEINADYVLTNLRDIVEMFKVENPGASLKGLELLGKNLKLFTDRLEIRVIGCWDDLGKEEQDNIIEDLGIKSGKLLPGPE